MSLQFHKFHSAKQSQVSNKLQYKNGGESGKMFTVTPGPIKLLLCSGWISGEIDLTLNGVWITASGNYPAKMILYTQKTNLSIFCVCIYTRALVYYKLSQFIILILSSEKLIGQCIHKTDSMSDVNSYTVWGLIAVQVARTRGGRASDTEIATGNLQNTPD